MVQGDIQSVTDTVLSKVTLMIKYSFVAVLFFLLSACANVVPLSTHTVSDNPAVITLVDDAQLLSDEGEYERAKSKLERALRLESNNAALWFELAFTNKEQGNIANARSLAVRAQRLSRNRVLSQNIDAFIAELDAYK